MTSLSLQTANSLIRNPHDSPLPVIVRAFQDQDRERWDRFVRDHPSGTFFHQFAWESGMSTFDFGRSKKGSGACAFKKKWNPRITDLDYQVYLVKRKTAPNFSPANLKFEIATQVWSRLPLRLANWLGPRVVRLFP